MQVTIYIPKDDEPQWEDMKEGANYLNIGIGAYIIRCDTVARRRDEYKRERDEYKKENIELKAEIEMLKNTSIKIGKGSKVGKITIGKRGEG